jgi:hypothetical protein
LTKRSHIEREFYPPPQSEILISECDPTSLVGMEVLGLWEAGPGPGCVRAAKATIERVGELESWRVGELGVGFWVGSNYPSQEPGARNFACGAKNYLAPGWFNFVCGANYPHQALRGGYFVFVWGVGT